MTLDEAIKHCLEIAKSDVCANCKNEHLQLAEWLLELKGRRKKNDDVFEKIAAKSCYKTV